MKVLDCLNPSAFFRYLMGCCQDCELLLHKAAACQSIGSGCLGFKLCKIICSCVSWYPHETDIVLARSFSDNNAMSYKIHDPIYPKRCLYIGLFKIYRMVDKLIKIGSIRFNLPVNLIIHLQKHRVRWRLKLKQHLTLSTLSSSYHTIITLNQYSYSFDLTRCFWEKYWNEINKSQ